MLKNHAFWVQFFEIAFPKVPFSNFDLELTESHTHT